ADRRAPETQSADGEAPTDDHLRHDRRIESAGACAPRASPGRRRFRLTFAGRAGAFVAVRFLIAAPIFVGAAPGTILVAARLIAIRISIGCFCVLLDDLGSNLVECFAPDGLILL